jgi:hypothetical protein
LPIPGGLFSDGEAVPLGGAVPFTVLFRDPDFFLFTGFDLIASFFIVILAILCVMLYDDEDCFGGKNEVFCCA